MGFDIGLHKPFTQCSPCVLGRSGSPSRASEAPRCHYNKSHEDTALPAGRNAAAQEESWEELLRTGVSQGGKTI